MSFYVWDCPEVSEKLKGIFTSHSHFYVFHDKWFAFKNDYKTEVGKALMDQLLHENFPEYKLHPKHGFVPAHYSEDFLDNAPESWSSPESPNKVETKQQNEKSDQKEENENMNRKENFQVVGQKVIIKNDQDYHISDFGESFIGLEVTVMSKFTIPSKTEGDIIMVAVMANEITGFGKNICCCFREDMCHPVKTEQEKSIGDWVDLLKECDNIEDVSTVLVMNGYHRIKSKD